MVISDNGASAEGGPTGTTNEAQFFNNAQESLEDSLKVIDEIGGPTHFNHYPWGWTWAGNTPFRRWKRETYRGGVSDPFLVSWPQGIRPTAARCARSTRTSSTWCRPCWTCSTSRPPQAIRGVTQAPFHGVSFAAPWTTPRAESPQAHPVLRDARAPGDLPRRVAGGLPVAGTVVRRGRLGFGAADLGARSCPSWMRKLGAVPHRRGFRRELQRRRRAPRPADRADRHLVRRGRQVRRAADRWQRPRPNGRRETAGRRRRGTATATTRTPSRSRSSPGHGCSTGRTASPPRSTSRRAAPRACCSARAPPPAATRSTSRTAKLQYVAQLRQPRRVHASRPNPRSRPGGTPCDSSSSRPASLTSPPGKGAPGRLQLYVDGGPGRRRRGAGHHPVADQPRRVDLRVEPRLAGHPGLPQPVPVHRQHRARDHRRQRRADPGPRGRTADASGPAVTCCCDRTGSVAWWAFRRGFVGLLRRRSTRAPGAGRLVRGRSAPG